MSSLVNADGVRTYESRCGNEQRGDQKILGQQVLLLSRRGILAIAVVTDIALQFHIHPITAKMLTGRYGLSPRHLECLLQALVRHDILKSIRGARGGYKLCRTGITVEEILRAASADNELTAPLVGRGSTLDNIVIPALGQIEQAFLKALGCISIEDLAHCANHKSVQPRKRPHYSRASTAPEIGGKAMQKANFLHGSAVKDNLADLRRQNARFCRKLREAIDSGMEMCPTAVNTTPGTQRYHR